MIFSEKMNDGDIILFTTILKTEESPLKKYVLDRALRKITEQSQSWPVTDLVKRNLEQIGVLPTDLITKSRVPHINRKLRAKGLDTLYFEHWKEIKVLLEEILKLPLSNDLKQASAQVKNYLETNTDCFFRLKNEEKDLQPHLNTKHWKNINLRFS
jgi:hypothetical protein